MGIPEFRRKTLFKEVRREVVEMSKTPCEYKDIELVKARIRVDHVRMYVKVPPKISVLEFMGDTSKERVR